VTEETDMQHQRTRTDEVLNDPALSTEEKRSLLANWASDAHAVEDAPSLRRLEDGTVLYIDAILEALKALDRPPAGARLRQHWQQRIGRRQSTRPEDDPPPAPASAPIPRPWVFELMTAGARAA
jgi:hypothetical protein